jgi:Fe-S cluster assembly iron-binding protein IscA
VVTVTDRAAQLLKDIQEGHEEGAGKTLRLLSRGDGFELAFDEQRESDHVVQSGEADVLLIGDDVSEVLGEATIDCQDTPAGPRFTLSTQGSSPPDNTENN